MSWKDDIFRFVNRGMDLVHPFDTIPEGYFSRFVNVTSVQEGSVEAREGYLQVAQINSDTDPVTFMGRLGSHRLIQNGNTLYSCASPYTSHDASFAASASTPITPLLWSPPGDSIGSYLYCSSLGYMNRYKEGEAGAYAIGIAPPFSAIAAPQLVDNSSPTTVESLNGTAITGAADNGAGLVRITAAGHGFSTGNRVQINGVVGTTEANGTWTVTVINSSTFDLQGSTYASAYTSGGVTMLAWADTGLTITGIAPLPAINIQKPTRTAKPSAPANILRAVPSADGKGTWTMSKILAAAVDLENEFSGDSRVEFFLKIGDPSHYEEIRLILSIEPVRTITNAADNGAGLIRITSAAHGYQTGDTVTISGVAGTVEANGEWVVTYNDANTFDLQGSAFASAYTSGGSALAFGRNSYLTNIQVSNVAEEALGGTKTFDEAQIASLWRGYVYSHISPIDMRNEAYRAELEKRAANPDLGDSGFRDFLQRIQTGTVSFTSGGVTYTPTLGKNQWIVISTSKADFLRVGGDPTLDWRTITGIKFQLLATELATTTSNVDLYELDAAKSASGLDSSGGMPYDWRYTYWSQELGIESNPCPIMAQGVDVTGKQAKFTVGTTGHIIRSTNGSVSRINVYRRGGTLFDWHQVASINNATITEFYDIYDDFSIANNPVLRLDNDQPVTTLSYVPVYNRVLWNQSLNNGVWTADDVTVEPNSGVAPDGSQTADLVIGAASGNRRLSQALTGLTASSYYALSVYIKRKRGSTGTISLTKDGFASSTAFTPGLLDSTGAVLTDTDGVWERFSITFTPGLTTATIGIAITDASQKFWVWGWQLEEYKAPDASGLCYSPYLQSQTRTEAAAVRIENAVWGGVPLECIWGPLNGKYILGIRPYYTTSAAYLDKGSLYWCNANRPDNWSPANRLVVTSSAEPLMNGFIYNRQAYVFSDQNLYVILPGGMTSTFVPLKTSCGVGLSKKWAFAVGPKIWFLGPDGIYETDGGPAINITENSYIRPLFHGETVNGNNPISYSESEYKYRLVWQDPYLWIIYPGGASTQAILRYHTELQRWEGFTSTVNVTSLYWDSLTREFLIGDMEGYYCKYSGTKDRINDVDLGIGCNLRTGSRDQGLPSMDKQYGDCYVEANIPSGLSVSLVPLVDDEVVTEATMTLAGTSARKRYLNSFRSGGGVKGKSLALDFSWETTGTSPVLYEAGVSYEPLTQEVALRPSEWTDLGMPFPKYVWGCSIDCETIGDTTKTIHIQGDGKTRIVDTIGKAVDTTLGTTITAGSREVTPASMNNIHQGVKLYIGGAGAETITVSAVTATTFTATFASGHADTAPVTAAAGQRFRRRVELSWANFAATQLRIISEDTDTWLVYSIDWYANKEAPQIGKWNHYWENPTPGTDMYVRGVEVEADSSNVSKTIKIERDGGTEIQTWTKAFNGHTKEYSSWTPVVAKTLRLYATDTNPGFLYRVTWLFDKEPPLLVVWDERDGDLSDKWITGLYLECDTVNIAKSVNVYIDGVEISGSPFSITVNGRKPVKISFNNPVRGVTMRFTSSATSARLYNWKWIHEPEPPQLTDILNWSDLGWPYEKYIKGLSIEADTANAVKEYTLRTNGDDSTEVATFTIQHNGRTKSFIDFDNVLAKTVRLDATSSDPARIYDARFVWDREPISLDLWQTQEESFGAEGYTFIPVAYICLRSTGTVTLTVTGDGTSNAYSIASTAGARRKIRVELNPVKAKVWKFKLTADAAFKVYIPDCNVYVRQWNGEWEKSLQLPFAGGVENP